MGELLQLLNEIYEIEYDCIVYKNIRIPIILDSDDGFYMLEKHFTGHDVRDGIFQLCFKTITDLIDFWGDKKVITVVPNCMYISIHLNDTDEIIINFNGAPEYWLDGECCEQFESDDLEEHIQFIEDHPGVRTNPRSVAQYLTAYAALRLTIYGQSATKSHEILLI